MLGTRRTIPFWRPKRRRLTLERALTSDRPDSRQAAMTAQSVADARARGRMAAESKRKARFAED